MQRLHSFLSGFLSVTLIALPGVALAAPKTFAQLVDWLVAIINLLIPTLVALAVAFFFWNTARGLWDVSQGGKMDSTQLRQSIIWGVLILFVMVSIWGILQLLRSTLLL